MATLMPTLPPRRHAPGILAALLVHAALLLAWQAAQRLPRVEMDGAPRAFQWIWLTPPAPAPAVRMPPSRQAAPAQAPRTLPAAAAAPVSVATPSAPSAVATPPAAAPADAPQPGVPAHGAARADMLQRALRDAGAVDRALRKENQPYIVAPLDSPQLRLQRGIEAAADAAPNKFYEAPKTDVLVNDTGDGARRTRVKGAFGTYCITERAPTTSIDMIEKHGKIRLTSCPEHEQPATRQAWRTARD